MSSHREAPGISKDPCADSTDLYAFVSPETPTTVTLIANYIPLQLAPGGPNFYEFADDVLYEIHVDNNGDGVAEITYQFNFTTTVQDPNSFLYATGQITSLTDPNWNRRQVYSVTRVDGGGTTVLGSGLACPPCNIGPRSIPDYATLGAAANHHLSGAGAGTTVFAGQRREGFYVDLGSIFDLGALRPFQNLHLIPLPPAPGVNAPDILNVHSIAIQVPINHLTANSSMPTSVTDPNAVLGVWTTASRQSASVIGSPPSGPFVQISRLGNPLINEVIIPMGLKDAWNHDVPANDSQFLTYYQHPELSGLLPVLYPGVFPHLAGLSATRDDLVAILLTGIPTGIIAGFQNSTGSGQFDMLRLNVAIHPSRNPKLMGILGGDLAGFPNGRRVFDDVVSIELRALAGLTYPLVHPTYKPDGAAGAIYDLENPNTTTPAGLQAAVGDSYQSVFPYLFQPHSGFTTPSMTP